MAILENSQANLKNDLHTLDSQSIQTHPNCIEHKFKRKISRIEKEECIYIVLSGMANLRKKNIPYAECKRKGEGIWENGDEPLACIHARIYQFSIKMSPQFWQLLLYEPLELEQILLNKWKSNLDHMEKWKTKQKKKIYSTQHRDLVWFY